MTRVRLFERPAAEPVAARPPAWHRSAIHLAWIRSQAPIDAGQDYWSSLLDMQKQAHAAHVRRGTDGGMGKKPSDHFTLPLSAYGHAVQHSIGEQTFFQRIGVLDPVWLAIEYALKSPCDATNAKAREWCDQHERSK